MKAIWLTLAEVMELTGWTARTVRFKVAERQLRSRRRPHHKREREYAAASLPQEFQIKLQQQRLQREGFIISRDFPREGRAPGQARLPGSEPAPSSLQQSLFPPPDAPAIALSSELERQARERLEAIRPMLDFKRRTNGSRPTFSLGDGSKVCNLDDLARYLAAATDRSPSTLWNWYSRYMKEGFAALADGPRRDKGESRFFRSHPAAGQYLQNKYLNESPRMSIRLCFEALRRDWPQLYNHGSLPPSYETVRLYLSKLPKPLAVLAREGERSFNEQCAPYLLRDYEKFDCNEWWCSDHGKHDVWTWNDGCFPGVPVGKALRPWLTPIEDMRSRKIVGFSFSANPSSHSFSSALRLALARYGVPKCMLLDNGKDFQKVGRGAEDWELSPEAAGLLTRLGVETHFCIPFHPQAKPVESWFKTVRNRWDQMWSDAYCGNAPSDRPERCDLALKEHERLLKLDRVEETPLPRASEFMALTAQWIEEEYNAAFKHSGRGMNGRAPDAVYDALLPEAQRRPVDPGELDVLLWDRQARVVSEGGCVEIYGARYEPADERSAPNLFLEIGRKVLVACDPCNLGEAVALDLDGRFLGRLRAQKLVAHGPVSHDDIKASMKLRARYKRASKDYLALLGMQAAEAGQASEIEVCRRRARASGALPPPAALKALPMRVRGGTAAAVAYTSDLVDEVAALMEEDDGLQR